MRLDGARREHGHRAGAIQVAHLFQVISVQTGIDMWGSVSPRLPPAWRAFMMG
jgi:hypothetical protein